MIDIDDNDEENYSVKYTTRVIKNMKIKTPYDQDPLN